MKKLLFGFIAFCVCMGVAAAQDQPTREDHEKAYIEMMGRASEMIDGLDGKKREIKVPEEEFLADVAKVINAYTAYSKQARKRGLTNAQFYNELKRNDKKDKYATALEEEKKKFTDKYLPVIWPNSSDKEYVGEDMYEQQYMNFNSISPGLTDTYKSCYGFVNFFIPEFFGYGKDNEFVNGIYEKLKKDHKADIAFLEEEHAKHVKKIEDSGLMVFANTLDKFITPEVIQDLRIIDRPKMEGKDEEALAYIIYAIASSPVAQGDWYVMQGLKGAIRLSDTFESNAFQSFFSSLLFDDGDFKLYATTFMANGLVINPLSMEDEFEYKENAERSYIYQREHYISKLASFILTRFKYDETGNYGAVVYDPCPKCDTQSVMIQQGAYENAVKYGYKSYTEYKSDFLDDKTFADAIGIANALLKYDGKNHIDDLYMLPWPAEKYDLVLKEAIKDARGGKPFPDALRDSMESYGLSAKEELFWIKDIELLQFMKIVVDDIGKYINKKEDAEASNLK